MLTRSPMTQRTVQPGEAGWRVSPLGLVIPDNRPTYDRPVAIDFFAGAGGFSMGFHQAGFQVAAAVEQDYWSAITYLVNLGRPPHLGGVKLHFDTEEREEGFTKTLAKHMGLEPGKQYASQPPLHRTAVSGSGWLAGQPAAEQQHGCLHFWVADIRNLTGAEILDALGLESDDVACVIGGPPCQGFSKAGQRNVMDPRNSLVFEFARMICEISPRHFVMENVPGMESMVTTEGVPVLDALAVAISDGGYGEYEALTRALQATGGRAGVRDGKVSKRNAADRPKRPTDKARHAARVAADQQPDLLSLLENAEVSHG